MNDKQILAWRMGQWWVALVLCFAGAVEVRAAGKPSAEVVIVGERDVQQVLDQAAPHSIVICNRNVTLALSTPIRIQKAVTLYGLNARLPDGLGETPLVVVQCEGVTVENFELRGNADTVSQEIRAPLLIVSAGNFRIQNGVFYDSSKDGVMIDCADPDGNERDVVGGVIRDITGYNIVRDVVSISGGQDGHRIRNVLVENIRCYGSRLRGPVEVSDGTDNITVRKVYAEDCVYAVDVQDHGQPKQVNSNILIQDVYARRCGVGVRTANRPFGHRDLTIRDVTTESCDIALRLRHTDRLSISNIRILDHDGQVPITITNCDTLSLTNVMFANSGPDKSAILIQDCNDTRVNGVTFRGSSDTRCSVVHYRVASDETFSGLQIGGISALNCSTGILLDNQTKNGRLTDYLVDANLARVEDRIQGDRGTVLNRAP